jgi:ribonucleoside-diphosphate reductase subunit M2
MVSETARASAPTTPSTQAAARFDKMALKSPVKQVVFDSLDDLDISPEDATKTVDSSEPPIEDYRLRFVGDVDLDEKDEPLLKESRRRFVLFPIQYHEVRTCAT